MKRLALLLALLLLLAPQVAYASGDITVSSSTAQADFPQSITFTLEAKSTAEITQVSLRYQVKYRSCANVTAVAIPDFRPGRQVKATWLWDMRQSGGLPEGTEVQYQWTIQDAAGGSLETAPATLTFNDNRYHWSSLPQGQVTIFWYAGGPSFADALMSSANQAQDMLARDTGARLDSPVRIYIYGSFDDLRGAMVYSQEWTGGVTFTEFNTIVIGISPDNLDWGEGALAHELTHAVVGQLTFNCYGATLPRWLDEGLAMYAEGSLGADYKSRLNRAVSQNSLISVRSLSSAFPADPQQAVLSYAESYSLVSYLIASYGEAKMLRLLEVFKEGTSYDDALRQVYGLDSTGLDNAWRASLGLGPRPATETPPSSVQPSPTLPLELIILAIIAVAVIAFLVRRRLTGGGAAKR